MPLPASRRFTLWSSLCFHIQEVRQFLPNGRTLSVSMGSEFSWEDYMIAVQWVHKLGQNYYWCCCPTEGAQYVFTFVQERRNNFGCCTKLCL